MLKALGSFLSITHKHTQAKSPHLLHVPSHIAEEAISAACGCPFKASSSLPRATGLDCLLTVCYLGVFMTLPFAFITL